MPKAPPPQQQATGGGQQPAAPNPGGGAPGGQYYPPVPPTQNYGQGQGQTGGLYPSMAPSQPGYYPQQQPAYGAQRFQPTGPSYPSVQVRKKQLKTSVG